MALTGRGKTILVVDDEDMVLTVVTAILEQDHYHVLSAGGPLDALQIETDYPGVIDLLLSDITMPGMAGPKLADQLLEHRPSMKVLFMSGYSDGGLLLLNDGWDFVKKPFVGATLLDRVAKVLNSIVPSQGRDHFDTRL